jgi:hypothetical protein
MGLLPGKQDLSARIHPRRIIAGEGVEVSLSAGEGRKKTGKHLKSDLSVTMRYPDSKPDLSSNTEAPNISLWAFMTD